MQLKPINCLGSTYSVWGVGRTLRVEEMGALRTSGTSRGRRSVKMYYHHHN